MNIQLSPSEQNFFTLMDAMINTKHEECYLPLSTKAEMIMSYFVTDKEELKKLIELINNYANSTTNK